MKDPSYWVSPREANLLITGGCNLRCRHCSVLSHGSLDNDLPLKAWSGILDELVRCKLLKLTLTGGEPMARADFPEFLEEVNGRPFRYSVNTNGTLLEPRMIEAITRNSSRLNELMVSLDGPDQETVDAQRGSGVFGSLVLGTGRLRTAGIPFGFYCTVTSLNIHRLGETAEFALAAGGDWIKFNNVLMAGPGLNPEIVPDPEDIAAAAEKLALLAEKYPGRIMGTMLDMRSRAQDYAAGKLPATSGNAFSCGGGRTKITIFPGGEVTPCDHLPQVVLGNILHTPLDRILQGEKMKEFERILNRDRRENEECRTCKAFDFCTGGCPVEAIVTAGGRGTDRLSCLKLALENLR